MIDDTAINAFNRTGQTRSEECIDDEIVIASPWAIRSQPVLSWHSVSVNFGRSLRASKFVWRLRASRHASKQHDRTLSAVFNEQSRASPAPSPLFPLCRR